jgi:DNA-binding MltR family transcriptional regulator
MFKASEGYAGRPGGLGASVIEGFSEIRKILERESDRAVAVLGPAYLDDGVTQLLTTALVPGESAAKLLKGEGAPLGTFSARIDLAHALALIGDIVRHDLHIVRRIRNRFAHNIGANDFSLDAAMDLCRNLKLLHEYFGSQLSGLSETRAVRDAKAARDMFIMTVDLLNGHIGSAIQRVEHRGPLPPAKGPKDALQFRSEP